MPVLGLDLDDTSFQYTEALKAFIIKEETDGFFKGMTPDEIQSHFPDLAAYDNFTWSVINGSRDKFVYYHKKAVDEGLFRNLAAYENCSKMLWDLVDNHDVEVYVITKRFVVKGQHARVLTDTAFCLDNNDIPYHDIMFVRKKVDVFADVYLDDSPHNVLNLREAGRNVITYGQSYNKDLPGPRVDNWVDAHAEILKQLGL